MLSHIKDLFHQRKERQQKRFFSNHFRRQQERQEQEEREIRKSLSEMKIRSHPPNNNIINTNATFTANNIGAGGGGSTTLPIKKTLIQQPQRNIVHKSNTKKELSTDNMTVVGREKDDQDTKSTHTAADELANRLVEQDNKRRSQLPSYPGLERFEMIRKIGEYSIVIFYIGSSLFFV
jgi:hypothetical protein